MVEVALTFEDFEPCDGVPRIAEDSMRLRQILRDLVRSGRAHVRRRFHSEELARVYEIEFRRVAHEWGAPVRVQRRGQAVYLSVEREDDSDAERG